MKAVLLVSHGSYSSKTKEEVACLVEKLRHKTGISIFEFAFLEIEDPDIPSGLEICIKRGATDILILLNFLNSGRHVNTDIPSIIKNVKEQHPGIKFSMTQPIGQHPQIADLFVDLINHA